MGSIERPVVLSNEKQLAFDAAAERLGLRPRDPWIAGYVDYEWDHLRRVLDAMPLCLEGARVLEFGCNVGASAILFSHLGARVSATDIAASWIELARLNAARYGITGIAFTHVPDSRRLPFCDGRFDLIACNSVLEYIADEELSAVQRELDRVLAPGGLILLTGTSNRLWPREVHSGHWFVNYLPRLVDRLWPAPLQRGIWPWRARHGFGRHYANLDTGDGNNFFALSRRGMGMSPTLLKLLLGGARCFGVGPGMLAQNLSCLLQKQGLPRLLPIRPPSQAS